jgi:hypothetical protein
MSGPHPTLPAWTRDLHDGFYSAELHDWTLKVTWSPNTSTERGAFGWVATRKDGARQLTHKSEESAEELELAMAEAEHFAARDARMRSRSATAPTDQASG